MQSDQVILYSSFVNKNTFVTLYRDRFCKWNVKKSHCAVTFPATSCHSSFTCLSWKLNTCKKFKSDKKQKGKNLKAMQQYAIGTATGDILLINGAGKNLLKFNAGHCDQVNCIAWTNDDLFYSCSNDCHIVEWNINETSHKWKWKADKHALTSISTGPDSKSLISAGKFIKVWNLKTKKLIWKFNSVSSSVCYLSLLHTPLFSQSKGKSSLESLDGLCILSASRNESVIKLWRVNSLKQTKEPTYSFPLLAPPKQFHVKSPRTQGKPTKLVAITEDEQILIFSHVPNGGRKKPSDPVRSLRLTNESTSSINILNARLKKTKKSNMITVAYRSSSGVNFQRINLDLYEEKDIIVHCNSTCQKEKLSRKRTEIDCLDKSSSKKKRKKSEYNSITSEEKSESATEMRRKFLEKSMTSESTATFSQLCEKLSEDFEGNLSEYLPYVKWIKEAVVNQSSKLETISGDSQMWSRLHQLVNMRRGLDRVLPRLQGTLDLLTSQIVQRQLDDVDQEALQVFEEESSDEMEYMPFDMSDAIDESDEIRLETSGESDSVSESSFERNDAEN